MQQEDVTHLTGDLYEFRALSYEVSEPDFRWMVSHRPLAEESRHRRDGVWCNEGPPALRPDVGPDDDRQQALLGAVEKMPEPVAILVPT